MPPLSSCILQLAYSPQKNIAISLHESLVANKQYYKEIFVAPKVTGKNVSDTTSPFFLIYIRDYK